MTEDTPTPAPSEPVAGPVQRPVRPLAFADALRIARGCTDYGGGYRSDPALFEAYQHGIMTVVAALKAADERGVSDPQVRALHCIGAA